MPHIFYHLNCGHMSKEFGGKRSHQLVKKKQRNDLLGVSSTSDENAENFYSKEKAQKGLISVSDNLDYAFDAWDELRPCVLH